MSSRSTGEKNSIVRKLFLTSKEKLRQPVSSQDWVTILTVTDEIEANLKKWFLEESGIECQIDPAVFRAYPFLNQFKITVPWYQVSEAKELLKEISR